MSKYYPNTQQADILLTSGKYYTLPKTLPGRVTTEDFVYFVWPSDFKPQLYTVAVESNDTLGATWRSIGPLMKNVELPHVYFGSNAKIALVPSRGDLPRYVSYLDRGNTYIVRKTQSGNGVFQMEKAGISVMSIGNY